MSAEGVDIVSIVVSSAVSSVLAAVTSVVVLKVNQKWHKEKLDRHSTSLKNAFEAIDEAKKEATSNHAEQQRELHRLEVKMLELWRGKQ